MPYPYSSPFLEDEAEVLGLPNGYEPYSSDSEGTDSQYPTSMSYGSGPQDSQQYAQPQLHAALPPNLSDKFIAPKLGELPGFVGDDMRIPIMKPQIPETEMTKQARVAGSGQLQPPTIDQSNLQAYTQHMGTSPFGKKPGFWNKLAAGLYGGASVLAATQAQPHVTRVNPQQIAAGVQGLLRPGQGRAMQEWDLKRRGLEDAARLEAMNNATRMRQYGIDSQGPLTDSRIKMNEKHGNLYDAIGYSRLFNTMNPKQAVPKMATNREALVTEDLQKRLNSPDPAVQTSAKQELESFKKQQQQRIIPAAQRTAIQALKQPYIDQGFDEETATIFATQDWSSDQNSQQEIKNTESVSRVESNKARAKRDEAQADRANRTPIGGTPRPGEARAATTDAVKDLVADARTKAGNDPAKAIDYINSQDKIDSRVRNRAAEVFLKEQSAKKSGLDINAIRSKVAQATGTSSKPASTSAPAQSTSKPATSNNFTRKVWDSKTGTFK